MVHRYNHASKRIHSLHVYMCIKLILIFTIMSRFSPYSKSSWNVSLIARLRKFAWVYVALKKKQL